MITWYRLVFDVVYFRGKKYDNMMTSRQGKARQGKARQGKARQGKARQGKAVGLLGVGVVGVLEGCFVMTTFMITSRQGKAKQFGCWGWGKCGRGRGGEAWMG
jgi:hypothetical protein